MSVDDYSPEQAMADRREELEFILSDECLAYVTEWEGRLVELLDVATSYVSTQGGEHLVADIQNALQEPRRMLTALKRYQAVKAR